MTDRLIPDQDTGIHLYLDAEGTLQVEVLLPTDLPEDAEGEDLPVHTQLALDLIQAIGRIADDLRRG